MTHDPVADLERRVTDLERWVIDHSIWEEREHCWLYRAAGFAGTIVLLGALIWIAQGVWWLILRWGL